MSAFLYRFTTIIIFLMVICGPDARGQQFQDADFAHIPDSLRSLQPPSYDSDAPYVFTNKELDISFQETGESIVAILKYHNRIKVFDASHREASIIAIPYYFDNNMEQISSIKAFTYLPDGGRIPVMEKDIRTININSRYNVKEFTMPEVEDGAILEYSYVIERRYIEELPDFFLSDKVPIEAAKLTITYPKYLRYTSLVENYDGSIQHDFVYTDTSSVPKVFTIPQPKPVVTERWMIYDVPGIEEEEFISTLDDYRAKVKFLLSEFGIPRQQLENSWEVVVARIREKTNPWQSIRKSSVARSKGDSIAKALSSSPQEVIQDSVYHYLNKRVQFSGAYAAYSTTSDAVVISGEPADQAAINQTLVAMLQGAGIEASPILISTRKAGKINMNFPSFYQFNGQMVQSKIGNKTYYMDASFPHSQPGLVPVDMYGSRGLILKQNSFGWQKINPEKSKVEIRVDIDANLRQDGTLTGRIRALQQGYPAQQIRQQMADGKSETDILKRALFDGYPELKVDSIHVSNIENYDQPIELTAQFEIGNYATSFTDGLKFRPMIVGYRSENPFSDTKRNFPITLDAPEKLDVSYSISLPTGYSADEGVQSQSVSLPGADFKESYNFEPGKMKYEYHINIGRKEFSTDYFPQLYNLYKRWVDLSNTAWLIEN